MPSRSGWRHDNLAFEQHQFFCLGALLAEQVRSTAGVWRGVWRLTKQPNTQGRSGTGGDAHDPLSVCVLGCGGGSVSMVRLRTRPRVHRLSGRQFLLSPPARRVTTCPDDGAGSPRRLSPHPRRQGLRAVLPGCRVHTVELDPLVARLARDHFGFEERPGSCELHVEDAAEFLRRSPDGGSLGKEGGGSES